MHGVEGKPERARRRWGGSCGNKDSARLRAGPGQPERRLAAGAGQESFCEGTQPGQPRRSQERDSRTHRRGSQCGAWLCSASSPGASGARLGPAAELPLLLARLLAAATGTEESIAPAGG